MEYCSAVEGQPQQKKYYFVYLINGIGKHQSLSNMGKINSWNLGNTLVVRTDVTMTIGNYENTIKLNIDLVILRVFRRALNCSDFQCSN